MIDTDQDYKFMNEALHEAKIAFELNEVPVGAIVVKDGEIIGKGFNCVVKDSDPTAHAEMIAIRNACNKLNTYKLTDCTLYITLEPCLMCLQTIAFARVKRIVYGAPDPSMGAVESVWNMINEKMFDYPILFNGGILKTNAAFCSRIFSIS